MNDSNRLFSKKKNIVSAVYCNYLVSEHSYNNFYKLLTNPETFVKKSFKYSSFSLTKPFVIIDMQ